LAVIALMIVYAAYFSYYTILNHHAFHTYAYDLGVFMQSLWTTLHGQGILYAGPLDGSCLGCHFQPVLFLILPLYGLFPRAETLLVLQSVVLALGALPVYWLARDELGARVGVAFAGLYLLYPALHGVNSFDFHPVALAVPMLLFCFYAFRTRRYRWGMVLAVLAMMCKENVPLVVMFLGFYWYWQGRRGDVGGLQWKEFPREREVVYPLCLAVLAFIWFLAAVFVLIPHFNPHGDFMYFGRYQMLFTSIFFDTGGKALYLLYLLAPLAFTSLLHPSMLIALPVLAQNTFSAYSGMYVIIHQYSSLLIPWIFVASVYGVKWLSMVEGRSVRAVLVKTVYVLAASAVIAALAISPSPVGLNRHMPQLTQHHAVLEEAISLIPEEASVFTQNEIFPHVCHRERAYCVLALVRVRIDFFEYNWAPASVEGRPCPWSHEGDYDYILVDSRSGWSVFDQGSDASLQRLWSDYGLYARGDGVYLFKLGYDRDPLVLQ